MNTLSCHEGHAFTMVDLHASGIVRLVDGRAELGIVCRKCDFSVCWKPLDAKREWILRLTGFAWDDELLDPCRYRGGFGRLRSESYLVRLFTRNVDRWIEHVLDEWDLEQGVS